MKTRRTLLKKLVLAVLILSIYPLFVLVYTWGHVLSSDLEGGRHGPLDGYRHALASAVVSYTLGDWAVELVTSLMEAKSKNSNKMDSHNNRVGIKIGLNARSFTDLEPAVHERALNGAENSNDPNQITWLPKKSWREAKLW